MYFHCVKKSLQTGWVFFSLTWLLTAFWHHSSSDTLVAQTTSVLVKTNSFVSPTRTSELKEIEQPFSTLLVNKTETGTASSHFTQKIFDFFNFVKYSFQIKFRTLTQYHFNLKCVFKALQTRDLIFPFHFFT